VTVTGGLEELIKHGLRALRDTLPTETDLNTKVGLSHWCAHSSVFSHAVYSKCCFY